MLDQQLKDTLKTVRWTNPKDLRVNPKNRNKHSKDQIIRLADIIKYQGWRFPIVVSNQSGYVVAGHGRLMAALSLGLTEVPVSFQNFESEEQAYAFMVSDNAIASWAELDLSGINTDLADLGPDFDINLLGIKDFTIDIEKLDPQCDEDDVPDNVEPKTKRGDIYQLGSHRLMCGDSTMIDDVEKLMNGNKADMVFTDPPYGINNDTAKGETYNNNNKAYDDSKTFDLKLLQLWDCDWVIWGGNYYDWIPNKRTETGWVVWDKRPTRESWDDTTREAADRIFGQHFEIAITNVTGVRGKMIRKTWGGFYGTAGNPDDAIVHRTQKPIELISHFLTDGHKTVLDYFGGSGSTLIACEKAARSCYTMELDPHYVDIIVARWEKYTGKQAELLNPPS